MNLKYFCKYCGHVNELTGFWKWFWTPHFGAKKYIKCTACGKFHAMARCDGRRWLDWPRNK